MLKKTFKSMDTNLMRAFYCSFVRPILEYAAPAWKPSKGDLSILERIQRRATKIPRETRDKPYEERLTSFDLQSIDDRRRRGDLIQIFKLAKGLDDISLYNEPRIAASISTVGPASAVRGHQLRYSGEMSHRSKASIPHE
jgi:hypothetical protein